MIRFGFCDILNDQGLGESYQPQPLALARGGAEVKCSLNCALQLVSHGGKMAFRLGTISV